MKTESLNWESEHIEDQASVDEAFQKVRAAGERKKTQRRAAMGATAGVIAVVVALAGLHLSSEKPETTPVAQPPNHSQTTSGPATTDLKVMLASDVIKKVNVELGTVRSISGTITKQTFADPSTNSSASTMQTDFRQDGAGDVWHRDHNTDGTISEDAYIASTGTYQACCTNDKAPTKETNKQDIDPVAQSFYATPLALVRGLSFNNPNAAALTTSTYDTQPAWQLSVRNVANGGPYDSYDITVLQSTAIPVDVKAYSNGRLGQEETTTNLKINPAFTPADFAVDISNGKTASSTDDGYIHESVNDVPATVGYKAFVPQYLPDGFALSTVTATKGNPQNGIETNGNFFPIQNQVDLVYRKGLQRITITTLSSDSASAAKWGDPLGASDGVGFSIPDNHFAINGGAFNDITAHTSAGLNGPDVWAVGAHYVLSISGDATRADMAKIAGSIQH